MQPASIFLNIQLSNSRGDDYMDKYYVTTEF